MAAIFIYIFFCVGEGYFIMCSYFLIQYFKYFKYAILPLTEGFSPDFFSVLKLRYNIPIILHKLITTRLKESRILS